MDYKTEIEENVRRHVSGISGIETRLNELHSQFRDAKQSLHDSLTNYLEKMQLDISSRNGYRAQLSENEKNIIKYYESGQYQKALANMPDSLAGGHKKEVETRYKKAKKNIPRKELVVCGILDYNREKANLVLILPIKFEDRTKSGSLEEALYEHNVNLGDFNEELGIRRGNAEYLALMKNTSQEDLEKNVLELASKLETDLHLRLTSANIKYGVIYIGEKGFLEEKKEFEEKEGVKREEYYNTREATQIWRKEHNNKGLAIPYKNLIKVLSQLGQTKNCNQRLLSSLKIKIELRRVLIEKESFDKVSKEYFMIRGRGKKRRYYLKRIDENSSLKIEDSGQEYSRVLKRTEAAKLLDIHPNTIDSMVNDGRLARAKKGYILGDSIKRFLETHEKKGGQIKTVWINKK